MSPSQTIVHQAQATFTARDEKGRKLLLHRLTALDTLRLFKAAGPELSQNAAWLSLAGLAFSVFEIDGVPIPPPTTETQVESLIDRLGDEGLTAIADVLDESQVKRISKEQVGNLPGTLS